MEVGGYRHAPAALPPGKTRYALYISLFGLRVSLDGRGKFRSYQDSIPGQSSPVFLNRRAAARYRALASVIPGRERFSRN